MRTAKNLRGFQNIIHSINLFVKDSGKIYAKQYFAFELDLTKTYKWYTCMK